MSSGTPPGEGVAVMAAGARLQQMRRRVRLSRLAALSALAAGPIALGVAVTSAPTVVEAATPATPAAVHTAVGADPSGYAQLFVGAWLRSSAEDAGSAQARLAQALAPTIELPDAAAGARPKFESVTAVGRVQRGSGRWSVTVAASEAGGGVRYFAVPVVMDAGGGSFTVTDAPAVVAGPVRAPVPASGYRVTVGDGALSSTVGEFLSAYLTGAGEVDRYLAPGVRLFAVAPAPYTAVTVEQVLAVEESAAGQKVPSDGTRVRIAVQVQARDGGGRWPLAYELVLKARAGRWDVLALASGTARGGEGAS
ncbi:conjugal transfer protein [Streptomyces collinus]|uniref:conjugal transfer protein n=1 Tax=Streptomyces collinus TaxID=42684 RepID=UPI00362958B4